MVPVGDRIDDGELARLGSPPVLMGAFYARVVRTYIEYGLSGLFITSSGVAQRRGKTGLQNPAFTGQLRVVAH